MEQILKLKIKEVNDKTGVRQQANQPHRTSKLQRNSNKAVAENFSKNCSGSLVYATRKLN
jgi:hypothetical protein